MHSCEACERRCLEKNPRRRWYAIGDVRMEIETLRANPVAVPAELPPVFSPDGRSVVFWTELNRTLKKIPVTGGAAFTICPADNPFGVSWSTEGILFGQGSKGIMRVSENGGEPELLVRVVLNWFEELKQRMSAR